MVKQNTKVRMDIWLVTKWEEILNSDIVAFLIYVIDNKS